jgi:gliding motility-associated protein GldC
MKTSEIKFTVTLDDNKIPDKIQWEAADSGITGKKNCDAMLLAVWDSAESTTMRIDLWTKEMPVDNMKRFFFETMMSMADTYVRATEDKLNAEEIRKFSQSFAKKVELFK